MMAFVRLAVLLSVAMFAAGMLSAAPDVQGGKKYGPHQLVRLEAVGVDPKAGLEWFIYPREGVEMATTTRGNCQFVAPPGRYVVDLLMVTISDGAAVLQKATTTVEIEPCLKPSPSVPPNGAPIAPVNPSPVAPIAGGRVDPVNALGKVRFEIEPNKYGMCTITVMHPQRSDGRWDLLCAAHCMRSGQRGQVVMKDGRTFTATTVAHDRTCDIAWMVTDEAVKDLPCAVLSKTLPAAGEKVWHQGFGQHLPENREDGEILGGEMADGKLPMSILFSSGDSGGGIFNAKNELIAVVCCTRAKNVKTVAFGGSCRQAWRLRPAAAGTERRSIFIPTGWEPVPIPTLEFGVDLEPCPPIEIPVVSGAVLVPCIVQR